jgi:drug/metabolite transporter (DMT)-like permease
VFGFQHALYSLLNQGILSSIFALGGVIVIIGSVIFIKERVKFCEYMGTVFIIVGTIVISLAKKEPDESSLVQTESPAYSIILTTGACVCFGIRSIILKYIAIFYAIDGVSASAVFLLVDGLIGGTTGVVLAMNGMAYANFPTAHIFYGVCSGIFAGVGVLCINIAVSTGVAGPAFAIANLCSVIQALGDWGFLGQIPVAIEWIGLTVSVLGGIIMSIGDSLMQGYKSSNKTKGDSCSKSGSMGEKLLSPNETVN